MATWTWSSPRTTGPCSAVLPRSRCSPAAGQHWIEIALRSQDGGRAITGARVGVVRSGQPTLWRRARTDGSYLSASDGRVQVGLGDRPRIDRIVVQWPDGVAESFTGVDTDRIATLRRGTGHVETTAGDAPLPIPRALRDVGASPGLQAGQGPESARGPRSRGLGRHAGVALRRCGNHLCRARRSQARRRRAADEPRHGATWPVIPAGRWPHCRRPFGSTPPLRPRSLFLGASLLDLRAAKGADAAAEGGDGDAGQR